LSIEPSIYLDALVRDFLRAGGRIVIRKFDTPRDLMSLTEPVSSIARASGSYTLFDDKELVPVKGQLTALVPQPEVDYRASGRTPSGGNATMNARSDGIIVGNLQDPGNWSLEPDERCVSATSAPRSSSSRRCGRPLRGALDAFRAAARCASGRGVLDDAGDGGR
jgi:hypothetical protein